MSEAVSNAVETKTPAPRKSKKCDPVKDLTAARKGDQEACDRLLALWKEAGILDSFCESLTDPTYQMLKARYGSDQLLKEFYGRKLATIRQEVTGENASPLEHLLAERIALCWEHIGFIEQQYAKALQESMSLQKSEYFQRCLDRAQKRYLSAIKMLATIRHLQIPAVQVNIGEKQINLVQAGVQANVPALCSEEAEDGDIFATEAGD